MIEKIKNLLPAEQIIDGKSEQAKPFLTEKRGKFKSHCTMIVMPKSVDEASKVVTFCYNNNISIVPQSGNTGLVGGAVASNNQIILSSRLMNSVIEIDKKNFSITTESGVTLRDLQKYAEKEGLYFPLSLPSENNCLIGGNLATNAGGISVLKYGNSRDLCLGLEVILPNGEIYSDLNKLRKRNIGSDLKHLFIGSEGTLGFITKASLKLFPKPNKIINVLIFLDSIEQSEEYFQKIYSKYSALLSSFELFNQNALDLVKKFNNIKYLQNSHYPWYIIMSFDMPEDNHNIKEFIDSITKNDYILTEDDNIWDCRYLIPDSQSNYGQSLKHDISTPLSDTINFIKKSLADLEQKYPNKLMPIIFGHMGDGNLHFNISKKENASFDLAEIKKEIKQIILQNVIELGGSFSSEHGVGLIHKEEFKKFYFTNQYNKLKLIKNTLDKNNIFNPNKILD